MFEGGTKTHWLPYCPHLQHFFFYFHIISLCFQYIQCMPSTRVIKIIEQLQEQHHFMCTYYIHTYIKMLNIVLHINTYMLDSQFTYILLNSRAKLKSNNLSQMGKNQQKKYSNINI